MIFKLKILLGIGLDDDSKDDLLAILIGQAKEQIRNYIHDDCLDGLDNTICNMVIFNYNKMGSEGLSSESYSGVNFTYMDEYPPMIMSDLKSHRKIRVVKSGN